MSGRRSKELRKKLAVGALVACSALHGERAIAQTTASPEVLRPQAAVVLPLRRFDIPAGTLDEALRTWEGISGVKVLCSFAPSTLAHVGTGGVSGTMPADQALAELLKSTGVDFRFDGRDKVTVSMKSISESIEVVTPAIELSSPKYTQPVLDTPQTVTVITEEVFSAQGATTLREVLRNTPGITFQAGEGGGGLPGDTFSLRGFSSGNDVTVDGVRDVGAYSRDTFNLEQVEVVKGPSSAVAGRGSTGGTVNLVTKAPRAEAFSFVTATAGSADELRSTVDVNQPLGVDGRSALRINAMVGESDVAGRDVAHLSSWAIAPALSFGIGEPSRFTLSYQHVTQDNVPDYGLPWAAFGATPDVDQSNFYGLEDYDYEDVQSDLATVIFERDLSSGWILRNLSRWGENSRDSAITAPRPPNRQLQRRTMETSQLANQTSLTGSFNTGGSRHDLVVGLDLGNEGTANRNQSQTTNQPQTGLENPDPTQDPLGPMPANLGNPSETDLDSIAIYAIDTLQLGNQWELTGGARWDTVDVAYTLNDLTTGAVTNLDRSDDMLSWSAGAVFKPRTSASLYASIGTSFNASVDAGSVGPALSDVPTAANNVNLEPEQTDHLELGAKWELGRGRAIINGAVFRTTKSNARTRSATNEPFVLEGEQRVSGLELGFNGRINERWSLLAGYSHLESEFVESANAGEVGAELAFTPENAFNVWADYRLRSWSFGGGVQFMDAVYRNSINTLEVPSYWLVEAMAAYTFNQRLTLRMNGNNLADEAYVDRVGGGHYIPGPGRSVSLTAEVGF